MIRTFFILIILTTIHLQLLGQTDSSLKEVVHGEVVISTSRGTKGKVGKGSLASIDEHLGQLQNVSLIKRGTYAWEPAINSMQTERIGITIDGMKIFSACTDKMDPVTSYVESGNLQRISLNSGLDGNPQATGVIGGSLDMKLRKVGFGENTHEANLNAGIESNGLVQVYGADAALSRQAFYTNFGLFRRQAQNYRDGHGDIVEYSQFSKTNAFVNFGLQPKSHHVIEGTVIYDLAEDVGYPALNMDVESAEGFISSLSYRAENLSGPFYRCETKVYYNHITHIMDDTKRDDVFIHMDMPGYSQTAGAYCLLLGASNRNSYSANLDFYYNNQFADMTMYPQGQTPMYMLTWPDVDTYNGGIALSDNIEISGSHHLKISAKGSWQNRIVRSDEGYSALEIYFPGMERSLCKLQGHASVSYSVDISHLRISAGTGWGTRTPVVTESYGYFLNNTFDRYDYIGNPNLKNESAVEFNFASSFNKRRLSINFEANCFRFANYIVGAPDERLSAMTLGASGVKVYRNLEHAQILNLSLSGDYKIGRHYLWSNSASYAYGKESTGAWLPLIAPITLKAALKADFGKLGAEIGGTLAARHSNYSAKYGESVTAGYGVWRVNGLYKLPLGKNSLTVRAGAENILNHAYTTYDNWNHIPQKGVNIFVNVAFSMI